MGFPRHELEQVAIFFSRGSSQPRDWIYIFCTGRRIFYHWVTRLRFVTASLLISWLQSLSAVILEPKKIWSVTASIFSTSICHEVMGLDAMILLFWMLSFKPAFSLCSFTSSRGSSVPLHFLPLEWYQLYISGCWYFSQLSWFQLVIHPAQHFTWCTLHIS